MGRRFNRHWGSLAPLLLLGVSTTRALAQTPLEVGPGKAYQQLADVAGQLVPGDLVLVDGDATYDPVVFEVDGTADQKITIRGVPVNGNLPVISGGAHTVELAGDHTVLENFEITGGSSSCLFHHAHEVRVRGVVVHDCPNHGVLGADDDSGSLLLEYSEVYATGEGTQHHQIYMATDENAYPGSVFRMQHCYVHDANGGNSVKSRAERNEIYYNWIEGGRYHELELIGPDEDSPTPPDPLEYREDSDVVGNVLRKAGTWTDSYTVRAGADVLASEGGNATRGRYRFLNNTILLAADSGTVFRLFGLLESIEMHNNVVFSAGGAPSLVRESDEEMAWVDGRKLGGSNNWILEGMTAPDGWAGTVTGADPLFVDLDGYDLTPQELSPLREAGVDYPMSPDGFEIPGPLAAAQYLPPSRTLEAPGTARVRPQDGTRDIGAFEYGEIPTSPGGAGGESGSSASGGNGSGGTSGGGASGSGGGDAGIGGAATAGSSSSGAANSGGASNGASRDGAADDGGCGCRLSAMRAKSALPSWVALGILLAARRGRRASARR